MPRKKKAEEHENHERWLVSYADFITLLFAFFTSMYAMSSVNEGKFRVMSESLTLAFTPSLFTATKKNEGPLFVRQQRPYMDDDANTIFMNNYQKVLDQLKPLTQQMKLSLFFDHEKITIRIADSVVFTPGGDEIAGDGLAVIDEVAGVIKGLPNKVRIEGHTDNIPSNTQRFPTNWDLSSARALRILKHLIDKHSFEPRRLSALGYGDTIPVASNDTPDGRLKNRRVEIHIMQSVNINMGR